MTVHYCDCVNCLWRHFGCNLKEIVHDYSPITNIGLNKIQESGPIEPQELRQPFGTGSEQLWLVTKYSNLSNNISCPCLSDNLQKPNDLHQRMFLTIIQVLQF